MQQFTVPQFIDVEDKIIGPITTRQFVIILGGSLLIFISYKFFTLIYFLIVGGITFINVILFSFFKVAGRPFHYFVLNFIQTILKDGLRVWRNDYDGVAEEEIMEHKVEVTRIRQRQYTSSRLAELSLIVDTQGKFKHEDRQEGGSFDISIKNQMNEIL